MSANKTQNFGLHVWEAGDDFLREEFNENFAAIDDGLLDMQIVTGLYKGTGSATQDIVLGFRPRAVLVLPNMINYSTDYRGISGLAVEGGENEGVTITDTGFRVGHILNSGNSSADGGYPRNPFRFIAWRS